MADIKITHTLQLQDIPAAEVARALSGVLTTEGFSDDEILAIARAMESQFAGSSGSGGNPFDPRSRNTDDGDGQGSIFE